MRSGNLVMRRSGVQIPEAAPIVVSRDMLIACSGTCLSFEFVAFGHSAFSVAWSGSGFRAAWLAVFVGVDGEFSDDFGCFLNRPGFSS
jgi:hypothetical protein